MDVLRQIVPAPGVVFVEMAMEAARQHLGPEAQLRDVQMVWPFVVPKVWPWARCGHGPWGWGWLCRVISSKI